MIKSFRLDGFLLGLILVVIAAILWPDPGAKGGFLHMDFIATYGVAVVFFLYGLTLAVPLLGWAMVSASPLGIPTVPFGLFEWPNLPVIGASDDAAAIEAGFKFGHRTLAYIAAAVVALHVAAAFKHQFYDRDGLLSRMLPFGGRATPTP